MKQRYSTAEINKYYFVEHFIQDCVDETTNVLKKCDK